MDHLPTADLVLYASKWQSASLFVFRFSDVTWKRAYVAGWDKSRTKNQ